MREIKFRVWDKKRHIMITANNEESWGDDKDEWYGYPNEMALTALDRFSSEEFYALMQFIGLKDKNGKEIYEGDIVTHPWHWKTAHVIQWPDDYYDIIEYALDLEEEGEVIGNIYENPELCESAVGAI